LRDGNLLGTKEVIIPVSQIDFIEGGSVYLNVAKEVVKALPSFKIKRRWG
jgi:hypothetical protein